MRERERLQYLAQVISAHRVNLQSGPDLTAERLFASWNISSSRLQPGRNSEILNAVLGVRKEAIAERRL